MQIVVWDKIMKKIERKNIDWEKTGKRLRVLREHDVQFMRYACFICHFNEGNCDGKCEKCALGGDLDSRITREELAKVFDTTAIVITNWEGGKTAVPLEDLLLYCQISGKELNELIVFAKH